MKLFGLHDHDDSRTRERLFDYEHRPHSANFLGTNSPLTSDRGTAGCQNSTSSCALRIKRPRSATQLFCSPDGNECASTVNQSANEAPVDICIQTTPLEDLSICAALQSPVKVTIPRRCVCSFPGYPSSFIAAEKYEGGKQSATKSEYFGSSNDELSLLLSDTTLPLSEMTTPNMTCPDKESVTHSLKESVHSDSTESADSPVMAKNCGKLQNRFFLGKKSDSDSLSMPIQMQLPGHFDEEQSHDSDVFVYA